MDDIVAGVASTIAPGIVRITAPNPSVMTGPGTNSYIVGDRELVLIDPGPDIESLRGQTITAVQPRIGPNGERLLPGDPGYDELAATEAQGKWTT
jgi:hypothetical protein